MTIEIHNISKSYGNKKVVDSVSVSIPQGKITSFIGPNGAGKSTVLAIMSRLLSPEQGEVRLNNIPLSQQKSCEIAKQLSILKQSNHINLRLTVEELVAFGRFPYSKGNLTKNDRTFIDNAIGYMNLDAFRHQYIDQLSGGQRQRAYIAMTLAQDTDYILLDEPLNNLDMKHSVQIMQVLRKLASELQKTIVIVIHDINFASCYSDYIIAMKNGRLVQQGSVDEIMQTPVLEQIYDMSINIEHIQQQKIAVYFR
ncbi:ATP-binding cassette domain-containing protein [Lonepinella koalarum]|uniref:Iron complex transport system ATP-binding protein n=1 Tax=Lonepinella koalarum TaxID=53417 RepID=A0A4V2PUG4_9PAST|nr:ATP-binding cassette domain-containing protein [Lonepinella koalarum]MDH2926900.1 iron ABC transporter ATP-binding protein [Lonepinella koalarum]TCK70441.1 iron complex transport system ATP-binding protein [Lonepinella koalarum]TFJ90170.1 ATP-binding cassette domain-containing protein [Lonepinella koalarum]TYG33725.1 ATP-binding cassette domain-containing protein [Lonepinella koalarum]